MDLQNLQPQQLQKAFKLCDILSLQDIYVATTILQTYGWDVQKAIDQIVYNKEQQHKKQQQLIQQQYQQQYQQQHQQQQHHPQPNNNDYNNNDYNQNDDDDPYKINDQQYEEMVDYADYQYQYAGDDLQKKKKMFQQNYITELPLSKTVSETLMPINPLQKDRLLAKDYHLHRHYYQTNLLKTSQQLCQRILQSHSISPTQRQLFNLNQSKINNNKKFITHLHKVYKSRINFTFGTFMLNLIRSYLDDKYLLVFILHQNIVNNNNGQQQKIVEKILTQPELAKFINVNCISYGMFDNSDDYQIVQRYVTLKELPAFAVFRYSKKDKREQFVASYPLLSNEDENCIQWLAKAIGVKLKKKQPSKIKEEKAMQEQKQQRVQWESMSLILKQQNNQYEEMEKMYSMKRLHSRLNKQALREKELQVTEMRKRFDSMPELELVPGKTIQIKFRMPISGDSKLRVFALEEKVEIMFDYIEAMHQAQFEQPYCEFDLTQTFPVLSLKDKKDKLIKEVFEESDRENIIVKEI